MPSRRWSFAGVVILAAALVHLNGAPAAASTVVGACSQSVSGDFNGDDASDLAVGVPLEDSDDDEANSGAVNVIYGGGASGLDATADNQYFDEDSTGVPGDTETNDLFGSCLTAGDFNGDDFADLAIGVPGEAIGSVEGGIVIVIYGSSDGLATNKTVNHPAAQQWNEGENGVPGVNETGDLFGLALAAGDFNGDGVDDLAVGGPGESVGSVAAAGAVWEIFGDEGNGLVKTSGSSRIWYQDVPKVAGRSEAGDNFGASLAVGNFDADTEDDLAVGIPGEDIEAADGAGAAQVFYGSKHGISANRDQLWFEDAKHIADASESGDRFGDALASGDFDDDGADDLAVGVPGQAVGTSDGAGSVHVITGALDDGLSGNGDLIFTQDDGSDPDGSEDDDAFGSVLNVADFDDDGIADLAVGVPFEDDAEDDQGAVEMFAGTGDATLLDAFTTDGYLTQDVTGADDDGAEENDRFGSALASGNFDGDGDAADLIVGVPFEDLSKNDAGAIEELDDADPSSAVLWSQDSTGVPDAEETNDRFGATLG